MSNKKKKYAEEQQEAAPRISHPLLLTLSGAAILLLVLILLDKLGYPLMDAGFTMLASLIMLAVLIGCGLWRLIKRISHKTTRYVVAAIAGFVLLVGATVVGLFTTQYTSMYTYNAYNTIEVGGRSIVIMRMVDVPFNYSEESEQDACIARMDARQALYFEAHPDEERTEDYVYDAYGYIYKAYPRWMRFFYNRKAESEGEIWRGSASKAELRYETLEDGSVRLFLNDPEVGDEGEIIIAK